MIDTGAKQISNVEMAQGDGDARIFSRLKLDEKFLTHLNAVQDNLKVSDEELSKRA